MSWSDQRWVPACPPDYLSLLTSLNPSEDRDKVEVRTVQFYQYIIFRADHIWWDVEEVSGVVCTLHWAALQATGLA